MEFGKRTNSLLDDGTHDSDLDIQFISSSSDEESEQSSHLRQYSNYTQSFYFKNSHQTLVASLQSSSNLNQLPKNPGESVGENIDSL